MITNFQIFEKIKKTLIAFPIPPEYESLFRRIEHHLRELGAIDFLVDYIPKANEPIKFHFMVNIYKKDVNKFQFLLNTRFCPAVNRQGSELILIGNIEYKTALELLSHFEDVDEWLEIKKYNL